MPRVAFIGINGKRYLWRDLLQLCKQQLKERQLQEPPTVLPGAPRRASGA
jgi:hypothetical protein